MENKFLNGKKFLNKKNFLPMLKVGFAFTFVHNGMFLLRAIAFKMKNLVMWRMECRQLRKVDSL
jgi:hypothetical protein